jgi:hypothetical protein
MIKFYLKLQKKRELSMPKKMIMTIRFEDKKGKTLTKPFEVKKDVPWIDEFEKFGFEEGFDLLETAVLKSRQKVTEKAAKKYLELISKKKSKEK